MWNRRYAVPIPSSFPLQTSSLTTPGAGKSTFSHTLCTTYPNFIRLSVDKYIFTQHGLAGLDCPVPQYAQYQAEAKEALKEQFRELLREDIRDVVLDFSFWGRAFRDEWRSVMSEETGWLANGNWDGKEDTGKQSGDKLNVVLVFFDAEEEVLWRRIEERRINGG
jgi:predicted kinase